MKALAPAARSRHIVLYSGERDEQRLFAGLGLDGAFPAAQGDFVGLATQNASGNKIDWFLHRALRYDARVDDHGNVVAEVTVRLQTDAPAEGLPDYVIAGAGPDPAPKGANRMIFELYTALEVERATVDGVAVTLRGERELGRNVYQTFLTIAPRSTATVHLRLRGSVPVDHGYRLGVWAQPTVWPDALDVHVHPEHGRDLDVTSPLRGDVVLRLPR
jgi:hypothetical protein